LNKTTEEENKKTQILNINNKNNNNQYIGITSDHIFEDYYKKNKRDQLSNLNLVKLVIIIQPYFSF